MGWTNHNANMNKTSNINDRSEDCFDCNVAV